MSQKQASLSNNDPLQLDSSDYASLTERVYEKLKHAIVFGELKPGDRISERELSRRMGASTTTIKNAIHRLNILGIVDIRPRRGTYVSAFYRTSIEEITTIRATLEGLAAGFASRKATEPDLLAIREQIAKMQRYTEAGEYEDLVRENTNFHDLVRTIARSAYIAQLIDVVRSFDRTIRRRALIDPDEAQRGLDEHKRIAEAIIARDPELAEQRIKAHILRTLRFVMAELD